MLHEILIAAQLKGVHLHTLDVVMEGDFGKWRSPRYLVLNGRSYPLRLFDDGDFVDAGMIPAIEARLGVDLEFEL